MADGGGTGGTGGTNGQFNNNAANSSLGDINGMSLPAVLNEAISVTGTYPFPYYTDASTTPNDPPIGVIPNPLGPVLVFGNALTIGGTARATGGGGGGTRRDRRRPAAPAARRQRQRRRQRHAFAAADFTIWNDRIPGAVNRSIATDFAAPAIDVPTFRRRFSSSRRTAPTTGRRAPPGRISTTRPTT